MQKTKNQHFIPAFYLRRFADPETRELCVLDLRNHRRYKAADRADYVRPISFMQLIRAKRMM